MNFPILSAIIFIPLIGSFFIFINRGTSKNVEKNSKYVAIFTSLANFLLSLFLWYSFDNSISDFQFVEKKKLDKRFYKFSTGYRWNFNFIYIVNNIYCSDMYFFRYSEY